MPRLNLNQTFNMMHWPLEANKVTVRFLNASGSARSYDFAFCQPGFLGRGLGEVFALRFKAVTFRCRTLGIQHFEIRDTFVTRRNFYEIKAHNLHK